MQLSKIITANIAVKWGQGSNLPVIRPDFFVTPTDYLFADFYNTQRTLCQCSIKSCYIIVIHVDIYSLCRSRRVRCTDHRTGRVKYFLDKHISPGMLPYLKMRLSNYHLCLPRTVRYPLYWHFHLPDRC